MMRFPSHNDDDNNNGDDDDSTFANVTGTYVPIE